MVAQARMVASASADGARAVGEAVLRCLAELESAAAVQRDVLASLSVERRTLAEQLAQCEAALHTSRGGSEHHRRVAAALESLRVRLHAADGSSAIATRALTDVERARTVLAAASPGYAAAATSPGGEERPQLLSVIEGERMRIARDMHDGPAQLLANLVLKAEIVERLLDHDPGMVRSELVDFKALVRHALEETRHLIFDLRPMTLDDLGLVPTVRRFLGDFEARWRITCRLQVMGAERRLPRDAETAIFRIVQEACTNARKHAMATAVDVTISTSATRLTATICDDGRGFDVAAAEAEARRTNHLGLTSMRERAALSGAVLDVSSAPGRGTAVRVSVTS